MTAANTLHRGIAARQFKRTFVLADGMEVLAASLDDGLLTIDLLRPEPQRLVRKIEIRQGRVDRAPAHGMNDKEKKHDRKQQEHPSASGT
jgi:hypothetical protein